MKYLKIYESFVATSEYGYYIKRSGYIIKHNSEISVVLGPYTDHSTKYHIYTLFNVDLMKYWQLNADVTEDFTYQTPEEYYQQEPEKMVEISNIILNGDLSESGNNYQNRNLQMLIINNWFKKLPELKENYKLIIQANKYNL